MKKTKENKGITLVALVITIIILLLLAGIAIATLGGENGIFSKVKQSKSKHIESEMKERLIIAIQDLQTEKKGEATLADITQNWLNKENLEFDTTLKDDSSQEGKLIVMSKNNITRKFLIDSRLNITQIDYNQSSLEFEYETKSRDGENIEILIKIRDSVNGVKQIDFPNGTNKLITNNKKDYTAIDYTVELGEEYKFIITTGDSKKSEKTIKIDDYFYKVSKKFEEGVSLDNITTKAAYNKPYNAKVVEKDNYMIDSIEVKMEGKDIDVDEDTGIINIEKVTGDIEINITSTKLTPLNECLVDFWSFNNSLESSVENNGQKEKFALYKGENLNYEDGGVHLESTVLATENNYMLPNEFSIVFKYKPTQINMWTLILGKLTDYGPLTGYNGIFLRNNINEGWLCNGISASEYYKIDNILEVNKYSTLAITYDGNICRLYKDGKLITKIKKYKDINAKMFVGGSIYSDKDKGAAGIQWGYANGYFKNLAIYNRRLSITELSNF